MQKNSYVKHVLSMLLKYWNVSLRINSFIQATEILSLVVILVRIRLASAKPLGMLFGIPFSLTSSMMSDHQTKLHPNPPTLFELCHDGVNLNDCHVYVT